MSRSKKTEKVEQFLKLNHPLLDSHAFLALSPFAVKLFLDLLRKYNGYNNGNINATFQSLKTRGWSSPTTLACAIRQLEAAGFIAKTRKTIGVHQGSKICNLYRFTHIDCLVDKKLDLPYIMASKDYEVFKTKKHAEAVIRAASAPRARIKKDDQNKMTLQNQYYHPTENVAMDGVDATVSVANTGGVTTETVACRFVQFTSKRLSGAVRRRLLGQNTQRALRIQNLYTFIGSAIVPGPG